jgi:hypothetical protein
MRCEGILRNVILIVDPDLETGDGQRASFFALRERNSLIENETRA